MLYLVPHSFPSLPHSPLPKKCQNLWKIPKSQFSNPKNPFHLPHQSQNPLDITPERIQPVKKVGDHCIFSCDRVHDF